ncbi:MAG: sulfatase-like hydrolase/transferase, partial [Erysipelotrichaceae bacterium]|nr:sulfatase-like hydrolase/transferase [Erysipelotrichaceae bacterium]
MIQTKRPESSLVDILSMIGFYFVSIMFLEGFLKANTLLSVQLPGVFFSLLFSISISAFLTLITAISGKMQRWIMGFFIVLICIIYGSQLFYFSFFKTFYTVYSMLNGAQVGEFYREILAVLIEHFLWLPVLFSPLMVFLISKNKLPILVVKRELIYLLVSFSFFFHVIGLLTINFGSQENGSPYDAYYYHEYPIDSIRQLGLLTSFRIDVKRMIIEILPFIDNMERDPGVIVDPNDPDDPKEEIEYNILEIDWMKLIEMADSDTLKDMHNYFSIVRPTNKNKMTGIYEGYNLILITAEGFSHYAVREDTTPTLYHMANNGYVFNNFYNPIWGVTTSDGEYVATTGLIPKAGVWSMPVSGENSMPYTMGNHLRPLGYKTMAFHNHTYNYYKRDISHPNMGYDYYGIGKGLDMENRWPRSDLQMMEITVDRYIDSQPFHTYYMTVSGHLLYTFTGNSMASKNKTFVENLPYSSNVRAYLATQVEFDRAMEYLLSRLREAGVADKTLIAISADHYPYGLQPEEINELAGYTVDSTFELYRSQFILYVDGMEKPVVIDKPVSSLDIIP